MILACGAVLRHGAERESWGSRADPDVVERGSRADAGVVERGSRADADVAERRSRADADVVERASRAIYEAALEAVGSGVKTPNLGGGAGTTEFTDAVIERVRTKLEIW
jgi:hypothetical protein